MLLDHYIRITSSSLSLMRQQSKADWIAYGDENSKLFHAKAKQRRLTNYIYSLQDDTGTQITGFEAIGDLMFNYYKKLLGPVPFERTAIDMEVILMGAQLTRAQQL